MSTFNNFYGIWHTTNDLLPKWFNVHGTSADDIDITMYNSDSIVTEWHVTDSIFRPDPNDPDFNKVIAYGTHERLSFRAEGVIRNEELHVEIVLYDISVGLIEVDNFVGFYTKRILNVEKPELQRIPEVYWWRDPRLHPSDLEELEKVKDGQVSIPKK